MKKVRSLAALLSSVSFSSMAANSSTKKAEIAVSTTKKATIASRNEAKKIKPQECGWAIYEVGCGGADNYYGHTYSCNEGDTLFAKMTTYEQYCGD